MKTNLKQLLLVAAGVLGGGIAQAGDFTHNGGQSTIIGGNVVVRDLVDSEQCTWIKGADFAKSLPHFKRIIEVIEQRNWLLSGEIQNYADKLIVCISQNALRPLAAENQDGFAGVQLPREARHEYAQAAVRVGNTVYIDGTIFDRMDNINRAYLLLHEMMHDFVRINSKLSARIQDMRAFVRYVYEIDMGYQKSDPELFQSVLQLYRIYFPQASCSTRPYEYYWGMNEKIQGTDGNYWPSIMPVNGISEPKQSAVLLAALECNRDDIFRKAVEKGFNATGSSHAGALAVWSRANPQQRLLLLKHAKTSGVASDVVMMGLYNYIASGDNMVFAVIQQGLDPEFIESNSNLYRSIWVALENGRRDDQLSRAEETFDFLSQKHRIQMGRLSDGICIFLDGRLPLSQDMLRFFEKIYRTPSFDRGVTCELNSRSLSLYEYAKTRRKMTLREDKSGREFYESIMAIVQGS